MVTFRIFSVLPGNLKFLIRNYLLQFSLNKIFVTITNKLIGLRYLVVAEIRNGTKII